MFIRPTLAAVLASLAMTALADENATVRFAIFRGYTEAIEEACPAYYVYPQATAGGHLLPDDRAVAIAMAEDWRTEMRRSVQTLGCDAAARDALSFTDLSFAQVWEYKR